MGIPPKPTVYGDDCLRCYPPGETPSRLHVFFGGISMGSNWAPPDPVPPNGYFILDQQPGVPCFYALYTDAFIVSLLYNPGYSRLYCIAFGGSSVFYSEIYDECQKYFVNVYTDPPPSHFHGGFGFISTMEGIIDAVNTIVPVVEEGARFEVTPRIGGLVNIRYANRNQRQNIIVQVPADQI